MGERLLCKQGVIGSSPFTSTISSHNIYRTSSSVVLPWYLEQTYWWAYLHPKGVRFFERQWLVNLILWGNFSRLRDVVLDELGTSVPGRTLQVACVYGDFSPKLAERLPLGSQLELIDVAPVQLDNVHKKVKNFSNVFLHHQDSTNLSFDDGLFDNTVVFFLLHEQPTEARKRTILEALRVTKPGGKVIFMDYHRPKWFSPFRYIMVPILHILEPYALEMWEKEIMAWTLGGITPSSFHKTTYFGDLYQKVVMIR